MAALVSVMDSKPDTSPVVIFLGSTAPEDTVVVDPAHPYRLPMALQHYHGKAVIDHWWDTLKSVGLNISTHVFIVTNARDYKAFEFWALGKGLAISHIINTGASLGDTRVDINAVVHTMVRANKRLAHDADLDASAPHDFLLIAADSVPPHSGAAFQSGLRNLLLAKESGLLLQPEVPHAEGGGPAIVALAETSAVTGLHVIRDVIPSISPINIHSHPLITASTTLQPHCTPICHVIKAADAREFFVSARALDGLRRQCKHHMATLSATPIPVDVVPVECLISWLARHRTVVGHRLVDNFQAGSMTGRPHRLPDQTVTATTTQRTVTAAPSPPATSLHGSFSAMFAHEPIVQSANARVGLLGNPSDGFGGKTLSVTIENFVATAVIVPSTDSSISLIPHPLYDAHRFANIRQLSTMTSREGYAGGLRLLQAAVHRFFLHCRAFGVELHERGFSVKYHTTIPRQVGLAGSSAILTAFVRALCLFYGFDTEEKQATIGLDSDTMPNFILKIENEELGITAGLQDRVVQVKQGLIHMDFDSELMKAKSHGDYTRLPVACLPPLFLAYAADPSDSGRIHAPVKQRWLAGDEDVIHRMRKIASLADRGLQLCTEQPYAPAATFEGKEAIAHEWAQVFAMNFDNRRALFGDAALGRDNIRMVEIAREAGASAKFPGSGGAVVGVVDVAGMIKAGWETTASDADARVVEALAELRHRYNQEGYVFTHLQPIAPS